MAEPTPEEILERIESVRGTLKDTQDTVKEQGTYGQRNRKLVFFDIVLTVLAFVGGIFVYQAVTQSQSNRTAIYQSCVGGNQFREADLKRWNFFINVVIPPGIQESPEIKKAVSEIRAENAKTDATRDCTTVPN